jgi:hypothetical protein
VTCRGVTYPGRIIRAWTVSVRRNQVGLAAGR